MPPHSSAQLNAEALEVPVASLHPDWSAEWCPGLTLPVLREAIAANPRLVRRPGASLARLHRLEPLAEAHVGRADLHAYRVMCRDPRYFIRMAGLASLAPVLAGIVEREAVRELHAHFSAADLRVALACRSAVTAPPDGEADLGRLNLIVEAAGPRIVQAWAQALPPGLRGRVRLMLPKSAMPSSQTAASPNLNHDQGKLVRYLASQLERSEPDELPADAWS